MKTPRAVAAVAVAALGVSALAGCESASGRIPLETIEQVLARVAPPTGSEPLASVDEPTSYRIAYDRYDAAVNDAGPVPAIVGREGSRRKLRAPKRVVRTVVRPFEERLGDVITRTLGFAGEAGSDAETRVTLVRPLPNDPRPRVYPAFADKHDDQRVVAGRRCQNRVIGRDEYCIDEAGLVLVTRAAGWLEIATKVTLLDRKASPAALRDSLAQGFTDTSRGSIRPIDPESAPVGTDWSLDAAPEGFELVGRYAVVPLTSEVLKRNSRKVIAGIVDVYVRGGDALVVERGGRLDAGAADDSDLGGLDDVSNVDLGALGAGRVGVAGNGPFGYREVRALPAQGKYVVVAGTLPADQLVEIARSLRSWPGTTIRYLDVREAE